MFPGASRSLICHICSLSLFSIFPSLNHQTDWHTIFKKKKRKKIKSSKMCKPVHAGLHFGLSPSPSSPATKQGCFLLGFSSPGDFTRAYREALGEVNKRSSENPFTGSSKVLGGPGCRAKSPAVGTRGLRVAGETCRRPHRGRPSRISSGAASVHKDAHCHRRGTEVAGRGPGAQTRAVPRRRSVLEYRGERPGEAHVCKVELVRAP